MTAQGPSSPTTPVRADPGRFSYTVPAPLPVHPGQVPAQRAYAPPPTVPPSAAGVEGHQAWAPGPWGPPDAVETVVSRPGPDESRPAARSVADHWLLAATTVMVALSLLVLTGGFHMARARTRVEQAPPGMAVTYEGWRVRLLSLEAAPQVPRRGAADAVAEPGMVFVLARLQWSDPGESAWCSPSLVLTDGRQLPASVVRHVDGSCLEGLREATVTLEVFEVPERDLGRVAGVLLPGDYQLRRRAVLTPPT